jgi:hypothetical protein
MTVPTALHVELFAFWSSTDMSTLSYPSRPYVVTRTCLVLGQIDAKDPLAKSDDDGRSIIAAPATTKGDKSQDQTTAAPCCPSLAVFQISFQPLLLN